MFAWTVTEEPRSSRSRETTFASAACSSTGTRSQKRRSRGKDRTHGATREGGGDLPFILQQIADDCADFSVISASPTGVPWHLEGRKRGKAAVVAYFEALASCVDHDSFEPRDFAASGDQVYASVKMTQTIRATGKRLEHAEVMHHWTFREGKVINCRASEDTALSQAAFQESSLLVTTARALVDAFNARDLSRWEKLLAPSFVADYPCAPDLDRAGARAYNAPFIDAFPDLRFTIQRTLVQGNTVVFDVDAAGTLERPLASPDGPIPPTGKSAKVRIVITSEIQDGRIAREQTVWNQYDLFQQLGLVPKR